MANNETNTENTLNMNDLVPNVSNNDNQKSLYHSIHILNNYEFTKGIFTHRHRYGVLNAYQNLTTTREVLFFTKPELNIFKKSEMETDTTAGLFESGSNMHKALAAYPFFTELYEKYPEVLYSLQGSCTQLKGPFNNLLGNMVQSNLSIPATTADMIETPSNVYGVSYKYRGSSEASDDNHTFSLEFKDTKYLPVYNFFKAYDLYEVLKHHGVIRPKNYYIANKILHDQYSIYKFILDEDMETIIFYAKYYGVKSVNVPRDVFDSVNFDNGLSYSIDFDAAFVEDSNPQILTDFNSLARPTWVTYHNDISVFDTKKGVVDMRPANIAIVVEEQAGQQGYKIVGENGFRVKEGESAKLLTGVPGQKVYKLKWRGDQKV